MKKLTFIHTVPMIIEGLNKSIKEKTRDIDVENIMDDKILKLVKVNEEEALKRLNKLVELAGEETQDIIITCSSLSDISKKLDRKVTMIDSFMHREACKDKIILLVATAKTAILPTKNGILEQANGKKIELNTIFLKGAIEEFKKGNKEEHDKIIVSGIKKELLNNKYDSIVLCQASMAHMKKELERKTNIKVLTNVEYFLKNYE